MMSLERFLFPPAQTTSVTVCLAWIAALVVLVAVAGYVFNQWMRRRRMGSRLYLFGELCRVHGLDTKDIGLLRRLAAKHSLSSPDTLFVDPGFFDSLIDPPDPDFRPEDVARLRRSLFRQAEKPSDDTSQSDQEEFS